MKLIVLYEKNEPTSLGARPHQYATNLGDGDQAVPELASGSGTGTNVGVPAKPRHRAFMNTDPEGSPTKTGQSKKGNWSMKDHRPAVTAVSAPEDNSDDPLEDDDGDILEHISLTMLSERKSSHEVLKDNKKPLTSEERDEAIKAKAVWHHGPNGEETPAVWKSVNSKGDTTYITDTHRAWRKASTLKGAIKEYHDFIKSTA